MSDAVEILVTHVDSPSNFFFKYAADNERIICKKEIRRIDNEIRRLVGEKKTCDPCIPAINSIVGFLHFKWLRWVRVRVKRKENNGAYVLFLLDYGHEITNGDVTRFIELNDQLKNESQTVHRASLGLRPCERVRDRDTSELILTPVRYYDSEAIAILRKLKEQDFQSSSKSYFELKETHRDGTLIGDVTVKTMRETYSVSERLMTKGLAMRENEEKSHEPKVKVAISSVPVANFEKIVEAICPNLPSKEDLKKSKNVAKELAAGVQLGLYTNQKNDVLVPKPPIVAPIIAPVTRPVVKNEVPARPVVKPVPLSQPKRSNPTCESASPPSDIVLYGQRLLPPLLSIDSAQFSKGIGEQLKNNLKVLSKVQTHCWPQIAGGRSMVIIGRSKNDLTSPYLPPILDALLRSHNENSSTGIGPIAIIVTKSSNDVKRISQLSSRCASKLVVVEVCGVDNKIEDVMNGCDLMVATAPAFSRMVEGISFKLFDKSRIKHVVFDCADELLKPFQSEINEIIRKCTHGRLKTEVNPQIIITANQWVKDIEPKLMSLVSQENIAICFEDFVEAAAYVKCLDGVGMKFLADVEEKILKLLEILQTETYKSLRTVVVTNNDSISKMLVDRILKIKIEVALADEINSKTVKSQWIREMKDFTLLVASDLALKQMDLKNVQNLIHFSIPKSWDSFSRRFASMIDQFYKQLGNKNVNVAQTTILLDDDNNLEFTQLVKFLKSRSIKISSAAVNAAEHFYQHGEHCKVEGNVAICSTLLMFGECKKQTCSSRHTFTEKDKPPAYVPVDSFIKFEFVSMKTPTNYSIKIKSRLSGTTWIPWDEKNREIERMIDEDLQEFFANPSNCSQGKLVMTGELFALKRDDKWFRCRVVEKKASGFVEVNLLDAGKTIHWIAAKLFDLPERFKRLDPLCNNLQILNLVPFDHEEFFDDESKRVVEEIVQQAAKDCTFMCKVRMAVRDIMFTDSFDAKNDATGSLKLRLKSKLLKKNICSLDESIEVKLRKLFSGDQHGEEKQAEPSALLDQVESPKHVNIKVPQESWKNLNWDSYYDVNVKHFKNPESFLVVLDASDNKIHQAAIQEISKTPVALPLNEIKAGGVCAVRGETTRRGKIFSVNENLIEVLLVDYGEIMSCNKSELFVLPNELITKIPFQTVHCSLMGVRPKYNMTIWPSKQIAAVQKLIQGYKTPLKMIVKKKNQRANDELMAIGMNSYDVTLANASREHLSDIAISSRFVDKVEIEKSVVKKDEEEVETYEDNDVELLARMLLQEMISNNDISDEESDEEEFKDAHDEPEVDLQPEPIENVIEPPVSPSKASKLNFIQKHPKIEWRQNDNLVYLLISAIDIENYGLEVTDTSMTVGIKYIDGGYERTSLPFYSSVDVEQVSHELRGLNIIVRLLKKNLANEWPRLTASSERCWFIKYSTAKIPIHAEGEALKANLEPSEAKRSSYRFALPDGFSDDSDCEEFRLSEPEDGF